MFALEVNQSLLFRKIKRNFIQCTLMVPNAQSSVPINYSNAKNNRKLQEAKAFASVIKTKLCRAIHTKVTCEKDFIFLKTVFGQLCLKRLHAMSLKLCKVQKM